ncbi:MAG: alpha-N-acetylglucosaminidase C-terminal domain-containing protein [Bacteroidales bacterium]|nr:alpha-N-acetylglucosaminidase C-terminal domain-containing protein [Bacteroidales bacterium]
MKKIHLIALCAGCLTLACNTPSERAAGDLARRIAPQYSIRFKEIPSQEDTYKLYTEGEKIIIEGNNALAMAVGLNRYLNDCCGVTVSWYADEKPQLPSAQPVVAEPLTGKALVPQRFFLNYCTFGYTMPWWKWEQWEHFIDWMALHGINLPLAITGQEALWQELWRQHGLTDEEIRAYFTGPAYLPWHRMNNIDGVDGPLPQGWIDGQKKLQKKILKRERAMGMRPVLPAFGGHVPGKLKEQYPDAAITDVVRWGGFPQENHCYFLSPQDSLYSVIQQEYLAIQTREFGTDHIYGFDLFNEVDPPSWDPETLADIARGAYGSLAKADPDAQWLQMGWLFYNDRRHWTPDIVKAYLEAVPKGKVTLLDYYTENIPVWERTEGFYGQPYILCYLGNFGGNTRFAGPFHTEGRRLTEGLEAGAEGIGCTLEGFGLNQWFYEYVMDRAWESGADDSRWLQSLDRRRGSPEGFWQQMADSIYIRGSFSEGSLICGRPCEKGYHHWTVINRPPYENETLVRLWRQLLAHPVTSATWKEDAVNLGSQALGNHFATLRDAFVEACHAKDTAKAEALAAEMRLLLKHCAALTACDPHSRLDNWLKAAESWASTHQEKAYYRHDAWQLITIWGSAPNLNDYASRLWSGLISHYYAPRWELFIEEELHCLKEGRSFDQAAFDLRCRELEEKIVSACPMVEDGEAADVPELSRELLQKWFPREETLLSYNVGAFGKYGDSLPGIARLIQENGITLAALQETDSCNRRHGTFQVKELADRLGGWKYHFASAFPFAGGAYGNGTLSRTPLLGSYGIPLPQADGSEPRSASVVETEACVFASVHLDFKSSEAAKEQARTLNTWFREHYAACSKPVFLCGDMNARPYSEVLEVLREVWQPLSGTDYTFSTENPHECIDFVLALKAAAPVQVLSSEVLTEGTARLSDHFPLLVKVKF